MENALDDKQGAWNRQQSFPEYSFPVHFQLNLHCHRHEFQLIDVSWNLAFSRLTWSLVVLPRILNPGWRMQSVLVLGGAGFVGRAVCRELKRVGCSSVKTLNRSSVTEIDGVESVRADALNPESYAQLNETDTLIHCIGILAEPRNNPKITFKSASFDTLKVALDNLPNLKRVAYISAADFGAASRLFLSPRYMEAKLAAEQLLATKADQLNVVIARPGFMYGADRAWTGPFSAVYRFGTLFTAGMFPPPLDVNTVAGHVVESLASADNGFKVLEVSDMKNKGF